MFKGLQIAVLCLLGGIASAEAAPRSAQPPSAEALAGVQSNGALSTPSLLRDIPQLQQKITLDATDCPVSDVLSRLSPTLQADLNTERDAADQRVTIHLVQQPVYFLMDRLLRLLSHHADSPSGYHWGRLDRPASARPAFQLWRDLASVNEENSLRDYPQREVAVLLRDLRNDSGMSPQERAVYKGDYPYMIGDDTGNIFARALHGLTDEQLNVLLSGQSLPLDPALFPNEVAEQQRQLIDGLHAQQKSVIAAGLPDPFPSGFSGFSVTPPRLMLTLAGAHGDSDDYEPAEPGQYLLSLPGVSNSSLVIRTYDTNESRTPDRLPLPAGTGPSVDLTPLLRAKGVTLAAQGDVGFTLQALAHAANISVYQEDFLRGSTEGEGSDPPQAGLQTLKAPLPVLIAMICAHWNYQFQKVGNDYVFWSRTWPQDRADDVPERLISVWRQRQEKQEGFTFDDRAEMAAALSWRQVKFTLPKALPEAGHWDPLKYQTLRLIGQLSPAQEDAAFSSSGLAVASLAPWHQQALLQGFKHRLQNVSEEQFSRATLTLQKEDVPKADTQKQTLQRITFTFSDENTEIFRTICAFPLPEVSATSRKPGPNASGTPLRSSVR